MIRVYRARRRLRRRASARMNIFARIFDAILPPHADVVEARRLSRNTLANLYAPHEGAAQWITSLFPYSDPGVRALIHAMKYHNETRALAPAAELLGGYVIELIAEKKLLDGWTMPLLVPIPPSPRRLRERGYGQAERILKAALPFIYGGGTPAPTTLIREERTSQVAVPRRERAANIAGAFSVPNPAAVRGRVIILIDDVTESGTTFADARRALLAAGAHDVHAVALAR